MAPVMQQRVAQAGNKVSFAVYVDFSELLPAFTLISQEELRELAEGLAAYINKHILGRTARALRDKGNIVSGKLVESLFVKVGKVNAATQEVELMYGSKAPYAFAFNYGSRPHVPPFHRIYDWKRRKYGLSTRNKGWMSSRRGRTYDVSSDAYKHAMAVWLHIRRKGTKAHTYFFESLYMTNFDAGQVLKDMSRHFPQIAAKARRAAEQGKVLAEVDSFAKKINPQNLQSTLLVDLRTVLYKTGQLAGFLQAAGLGEYAFRRDIYNVAKGLGDYSAAVGGGVLSRLEIRSVGRITGQSLHRSIDGQILTRDMGPFSARILRYSGGKFAGSGLKGLSKI